MSEIPGGFASIRPLDPEIQELLAVMARESVPPGASVTEMRDAQLKAARLIPPGPPLLDVVDVDIGEGDTPLRGRLYFGSDKPTILMVFLHGGGWTLGGVEVSDAPSRRIAAGTGAIVLSVDYRLAPEHPFPAAFEDAHQAVRWAANNAARLTGSDEAKIVIAGESAGANLAAAVALLARSAGPAIHAQILSCPALSADLDTPFIRNMPAPFPPKDLLPLLFKGYAPDERVHRDPRFAPLLAENVTGLPPALILTVELDAFREQGEMYFERLKGVGVLCEILRYDGTVHGFLELDNGHRQSREAISAMAGFLRRHVRDRPDRS
ncbi:acetyl esterase [Sphingobium xenophagum]|uniref:Acetyl esterase n=1 Tax=Sphingobium xenophagum TaxID=121428 RepID=A0ABU1X5H0_SPHXE|nr:alpha/beta hydrolase [Sphingobium xenophagum]MDR7156831.1 acetyl esterase [Sphingobium xenophagum]